MPSRLFLDDDRTPYVPDMIKQIKFVSVPVADQDRALDFYTEKLGFTIITDQPFDDKQRWIELRVPKAETRVVLFTTDEDKGRIGTFMNMSYTCDDLQKTYEELKERGSNSRARQRKSPGAATPSSRTAKETVSFLGTNLRAARPADRRGWPGARGSSRPRMSSKRARRRRERKHSGRSILLRTILSGARGKAQSR